jgi:hypothetical protein
MLLAFENAFEDISNDLNLRPIDFDIDKIEIKEDIINQQQTDAIRPLKSDQKTEALADAELEDI